MVNKQNELETFNSDKFIEVHECQWDLAELLANDY